METTIKKALQEEEAATKATSLLVPRRKEESLTTVKKPVDVHRNQIRERRINRPTATGAHQEKLKNEPSCKAVLHKRMALFILVFLKSIN